MLLSGNLGFTDKNREKYTPHKELVWHEQFRAWSPQGQQQGDACWFVAGDRPRGSLATSESQGPVPGSCPSLRAPCPTAGAGAQSRGDPPGPSSPSSFPAPFSFSSQSLPASGSFSNELALHIKWPKYMLN